MSKNNSAKDAIKAYLDNRAVNDPQFALAYAKKNKSINRCFDYIMGEASKRGSAVCMTDEEVFGLAVHYYDEDDIKIVEVPGGGRVSHSAPVQLTEDEKQQAKKEAMERFGDAYIREQREQGKKRRTAASTTTDAPMGSLFDMAAL